VSHKAVGVHASELLSKTIVSTGKLVLVRCTASVTVKMGKMYRKSRPNKRMQGGRRVITKLDIANDYNLPF
jgi:hypothetical protein